MSKTKSDHALAVIKAGISAVPVIGGAIASLVGDYVPLSTQKSVEQAINMLQQKLEELEGRIDPNTVNKDEFAELFKSCYLTIVRTHQKSKINAATSLIANILLREDDPEKVSYTELDHFVRCLDSLSIGALEALGHVAKLEKRFTFEWLQNQMPDIDPSLLMGLLGELNSMDLVHLTGAPPVRTPDYGNYPIEQTTIGARFMQFLIDDER